MKSGIYHLIIRLPRNNMVQVGRLGAFFFPKGFYVYTGSAQVSLGRRVARHISQVKKLHWHIDYLLQSGIIVNILTTEGSKNRECVLSNQIALGLGGRVVAEKFGSSDCRCRTHLYFFEDKPEIHSLFGETEKYKIGKKEDFSGY